MAKAGIQVQVGLAEIYQVVCPDCQVKIRELVREKISDDMVFKVIGVEKPSVPQK